MALDNDNHGGFRQLVSLDKRLREVGGPNSSSLGHETGNGSRSILIAEDNAINQKVIERMVQKLGYRVQLVSNGREAIEALARSSYSLIFMDCQMPEMDGFEACRQIRRLNAATASTRIPIVAITANAMKGDRERCLAAGMDDYVSKPFTQENLRIVIERWLSVESRQAIKQG